MGDRGGFRGHLGIVMLITALVQGGTCAAEENRIGFTVQERAAVVATLRAADEFEDGLPDILDDDTLRASLLRYAKSMLGLRVKPASINRLWAIAPPARQVEAELNTALATDGLGPWLAGLAPSDGRYRSLATWRGHYLALVRSGGWSALPDGPTISLGAQGPAVDALRQRLAVESGRSLTQSAHAPFDRTLAASLADFQRRHSLPADGVLGPATRRALNVPAEQRLQQIDANLERWRWVRALPADRIEIDAAAAQATVFEGNVATFTMRVVVGDLNHRTPMFASRVDAVVFNPPWNVPTSIAEAELYPKEAAHPGYLARNHFAVVNGGLRQEPGPDNALGQVKFDMVSPFGVYLHDTSGKAAFFREQRQLSHGCVRLQEPLRLAAALLATQGWSPERIQAAIALGSTQRVILTRPMPVYVLYWTAVVDKAGDLEFRSDPYGWDVLLLRGLAASSD